VAPEVGGWLVFSGGRWRPGAEVLSVPVGITGGDGLKEEKVVDPRGRGGFFFSFPGNRGGDRSRMG